VEEYRRGDQPLRAISVTLSPALAPRARAKLRPEHDAEFSRHERLELPHRHVQADFGDFLLQLRHDAAHRRPPDRWRRARASLARFTNGAAAATCGCAAASLATACQSASRLSAPVICTCDTTPRMRARTSFWNPFITEEHHDQRGDASAMPSIEVSEMKEMK